MGILRRPESDTELQDQVAQLFAETREDVYRYLLTLGVHPPKAQESVQEVFLRLYTTLKKGEKIENLRGWVFRVAHNLGLKVRARQANEEAIGTELEIRLIPPGKTPNGSCWNASACSSSTRRWKGFPNNRSAACLCTGGPAVSRNRFHPGDQRLSRRRVSASRPSAAKEGAR